MVPRCQSGKQHKRENPADLFRGRDPAPLMSKAAGQQNALQQGMESLPCAMSNKGVRWPGADCALLLEEVMPMGCRAHTAFTLIYVQRHLIPELCEL